MAMPTYDNFKEKIGKELLDSVLAKIKEKKAHQGRIGILDPTCKNTFVSSAINVSSILIVVATGSVLGKILAVEGVPGMLENALTSMSSNVYVLLEVINLILLIVSCVMETFTAIINLSPILYPIVAQYGIDIYNFGVMMILAKVQQNDKMHTPLFKVQQFMG